MNPLTLLSRNGIGLAFGLIIQCGVVSAQEARFFRIVGPVATTITALSPDGTVTWTNAPVNAMFTVQTRTDPAAGDWVDWVQVPVNGTMTVHRIYDPNPPTGMAFIPAGSFTMGDAFNDWLPDHWLPGWVTNHEIPTHPVFVSAFYMEKYEVTKTQWDEVYQWATNHGYSFTLAGAGKGGNHPVHTINWHDIVKWCNARSEREGRTPAYYTSATQTTVYRTGEVNVQNDWVKWNSGYRLPTEAEWEKAARGGISGQRFAVGNTVTHSQANYFSKWTNGVPTYTYDLSPTSGYHPDWTIGAFPHTSPVGSFAPNGYGLYDLVGNISEWCWDWHASDYYANSPTSDPRGPASGPGRIARGSSWCDSAIYCRTAFRIYFWPGVSIYFLGFRCSLPLDE